MLSIHMYVHSYITSLTIGGNGALKGGGVFGVLRLIIVSSDAGSN